MSKLDELTRRGGGNAAESMGAGPGFGAPVHGAQPAGVPPRPERLQGVAKARNVAEIARERIVPDPDQPREEFEPEALARLAESLKAKGQLQPIRVRWDEGQGRYVIVLGERRWRAACLAGLETMACVIMDEPATPAELLELQLVENLLREDLSPLEQARAYRQLMVGNGWSVSQLARALAIDHSGVSRALALLELPESVQAAVEQGTLPPATAYELSKLDDPAAVAEVAGQVVAEGFSRAETVAAVRERSGRKGKGERAKAKRPARPWTRKASNGCRVTVERPKGLDDGLIRAALVEALAQLEARERTDQAA